LPYTICGVLYAANEITGDPLTESQLPEADALLFAQAPAKSEMAAKAAILA
jgi:hypothetical protein